MIKQIFSGFLVGVANIIPGVSGGTLLFLLGLYERTLGAVGKINAKSVTALLRYACGTIFSKRRTDSFKRLIEQVRDLDLPFLALLLGGAGAAILLLSNVMEYLLEKQFSNTFAFFFGLIAISIVMSLKMLKTKKAVFIVYGLIGAAITIAITASVDPAIDAGVKSERYRMQLEENSEFGMRNAELKSNYEPEPDAIIGTTNIGTSSVVDVDVDVDVNSELCSAEINKSLIPNSELETDNVRFKLTGHYSPAEFITGAIAGAVSVSAMVLPGLSGSLVLILMGKYYDVISAVSGLKTLQLDYAIFLAVVALGMLFGLLAFARAISFVLKRWYDETVAFLIGLMVGSLYALWPFKEAVMMDQYVKKGGVITLIEDSIVLTNINIMPESIMQTALALVFCAVGIGVMIAIEKYSVAKPE